MGTVTCTQTSSSAPSFGCPTTPEHRTPAASLQSKSSEAGDGSTSSRLPKTPFFAISQRETASSQNLRALLRQQPEPGGFLSPLHSRSPVPQQSTRHSSTSSRSIARPPPTAPGETAPGLGGCSLRAPRDFLATSRRQERNPGPGPPPSPLPSPCPPAPRRPRRGCPGPGGAGARRGAAAGPAVPEGLRVSLITSSARPPPAATLPFMLQPQGEVGSRGGRFRFLGRRGAAPRSAGSCSLCCVFFFFPREHALGAGLEGSRGTVTGWHPQHSATGGFGCKKGNDKRQAGLRGAHREPAALGLLLSAATSSLLLAPELCLLVLWENKTQLK